MNKKMIHLHSVVIKAPAGCAKYPSKQNRRYCSSDLF